MYWNERMIYWYTCKLDRIKLQGWVIGWPHSPLVLINLDLLTPFLEKLQCLLINCMFLIQDIQKTFHELKSSMKRDRCQVDTVLQTVANEGSSSNTLSLIQKLYQLSGEAKVNLMYLKVKHEISVTEITFLLKYQVVSKYLFLGPLDYIFQPFFSLLYGK